ncbi:VWA domain-containing protein [Halobaculum sp. WSA2]|uniref:VWA domain-containing protein n=1 Tax=Halobaculum saliterrae TaxID=2073113 RepID=A0A6B0SXQ6_9EURY|nr:vWA domain-containing protein [Halobaculum saliterrae]MXR40740.1 VWA domain-containing protein [Halobaculum saliterrae]
MEITQNTPDFELSALSISRRASEARRDTLERLASICTPRGVSVSVQFVDDGAACTPDTERAGEAYVIQIPTNAYDQPGTDLPEAVWNKRVQVGLLFHELGHVLYSDFERFNERLESVRPEWREAFKTVYNAAEDGVVETQIANEFRVTADLTLLNETFVRMADDRHRRYSELFEFGPDTTAETGRSPNTSGHDEPTLRAEYSVLDAIRVGLIDNGFTKGDRFAALVDPTNETRTVRNDRGDVLQDIAQPLRQYAAAMLSEPDPTARVELAWDFFQDVRDHLAPLPVFQSRGTDVFVVRPADVTAGGLGGGRRAGKLPSAQGADAYVRLSGGDDDNGPTLSSDEQEETTRPTSGQTGAPGGDRSHLPPGWVAQRELERYARRAARGRSVRGQSRTPLETNAHDLRDLTRDESSRVERIGIAEASGDESSRYVWETAVERAKQLQADLATQLRRRRRTSFDGGHRSGRLDGSRVIRVVRGDQRVFQRRSAGDDRDYSCVIILDRSGSMDGDRIMAAERAVAQLLAAFAAVDVDVGLLSLFEGVPHLEVPVGGSPANHVSRFIREEAHGGTPLTGALSAGRALLEEGQGTVPLLFVVTDGEPNQPETYQRELAGCSFPVFGVYVRDDAEDDSPGTRDFDGDSDHFDRLVHTDGDSLDTRLRALVKSLFRTRPS